MKKTVHIFAFILTLLTIASCNKMPAPTASKVGDISELNNSEPAPINIDTHEAILFNEIEIKKEFQQVVDACSEVISGLDVDLEKSGFPNPTLEEYSKLCEIIGRLGHPVSYYDLDMPNYQKVQTFWREVQEGNDAKITIYCLNNWAITADILVCRNKELYHKSQVYYDFAGDGEIRYFEAVEKLDDMRMTEKGYLLYHIPSHDGFGEEHGGYRVSPLGNEKRESGRKYVWGIGYYPNGMLRYDWDSNDFSKLNLEWVFESLYTKFNGNFPYDIYSETDEEGRVLIPADVMEATMLKQLPLTVDKLRTSIPYNVGKNAYAYRPFAGGGYSPLSEVVEIAINFDGSQSLTVDAVSVEFGNDKSMRNVLTVMDSPDGSIKYISNVVISSFE